VCGIAGVANWGDQNVLARMTKLIAHRGPDGSGVWEHTSCDGVYVALGNQRLAILDLSPAGHMPMPNITGTVWITYNGEVYNFRALRAGLEAKGHAFRSETDTEVVLHLMRYAS
jgi:asparagine synthase (glutamine-hydrolysing)